MRLVSSAFTKMAAVEKDALKNNADTTVDDDDAWLYGGINKRYCLSVFKMSLKTMFIILANFVK